jgi:choline dehydrogenase-like flavoprotein
MLLECQDCPDNASGLRANVLVVGAGTVGLMLAVDLARRGVSVLLLEAGPKSLSKDSQSHFEAARNVGLPLEGLHLGRFRVLGGTSNFWGGQLVRFDPIVFGPRAWVSPDAGWPITLADVAPYYDRAFNALGMAHVERSDADVARRLKIEIPRLPTNLDFVFTRWTPETNVATVFETDIRTSTSLRVVTNAQVVALAAEDDGARLTGVEVVDLGQRRLRFSADHVVLANGTVEIARLLKLPLAGQRRSPWSENVWVGRGFMDHVDCVAGDVELLDKERFHSLFDNAVLNGLKYQPKLKLSEKTQIEQQLLGIASHFIFKSSFADNLVNAKIFFKAMMKGKFEGGMSALPRQFANMATIGLPMIIRYLRHNRMYNPADLGIQLRLTMEQRQVRDSGIRLSDEVDAFGMPKVEMDWKVDGAELETLASFAEMVSAYVETSGLARVQLDPRLRARDGAFMSTIDDANHQIGMARMAATPEHGVVDGDLLVHGTQNLYVVGAAVYPSSGFANPTFTAMALGLRLADTLARRTDR